MRYLDSSIWASTELFQVATLMLLAPSIKEKIIFVHNAIIEQIPEYKTREIINEPLWESQRKMWSALLSETYREQRDRLSKI